MLVLLYVSADQISFNNRRPDEGAMFFLKREQVDTDSLKDSVTHHSYGKWK